MSGATGWLAMVREDAGGWSALHPQSGITGTGKTRGAALRDLERLLDEAQVSADTLGRGVPTVLRSA